MITAEKIKELRELTSAGILDCKKALGETNGDLQAAVDWLRKKGLATASKKAGRVAAEGLIGVAVSDRKGAVVEVNSETDFVARNDKFQQFVQTVSKIALEGKTDIEALKSAPFQDKGHAVQEELTQLIATIGENINLRRAQVLEVSNGAVASYIHNVMKEGIGGVGVLVALESKGDKEKLMILGRKIAMHIAAAHPRSRSIDDLDPKVLEAERNVLVEQAKESGKPAEFIEKVVEGRLRKFYQESILFEQVFLVDNTKRSVAKVIEDAAKEMNCSIQLTAFAHFKLGEGIERKEVDFAAEVAEQLKK